MIADGKQLSVCSGATFNYSITTKYYIKIEPVSEGQCQNFELLSNINKGIFYQRFGKTLEIYDCLLYTSPSPRDQRGSRMPSSA